MERKNYLWSMLAFVIAAMLSLGFMSCGGSGDDDENLKPASVSLAVSPTEISLTSNAGAQGSLTIACTADWTVSCSDSWITLSMTSGTGAGAIIVTAVTENSNSTERMSTIVVKCGEVVKNVSVKQAAQDVLILSGLDAPFDAQAGSIQTAQELTITCNGRWTLEGKPEWLDISALSGSGTSVIKVWPNSANEGSGIRETTLIVKSGTKSESKKVSQRAGLESDCYAKPSNLLTFVHDAAFNYTCGNNTKYFYVRAILTDNLSRLTNAELVQSVINEGDKWDRTTKQMAHLPSCFGEKLEANTSYTIVTVSYSNSDKLGDIEKFEFKTKPTVNQPNADIVDVTIGTKNNTPVYGISVRKGQNGYCEKYYVWGAAGSYISSYYLYPALKCWYIKQDISSNSLSHSTNYSQHFDEIIKYSMNIDKKSNGREYLHGPLSQEESISSDLAFSNDDGFIDVIVWAMDANGELSGYVTTGKYTISNSSRKRASANLGEIKINTAQYMNKGYGVLKSPSK